MLVAGLAVLFGSALPEVRAARALVDHGRSVTGTITAVFDRQKASERYAEYAYAVDGTTYKGRMDGYTGPYNAKGPIDLRYLPERPDYSSPDRAARLTKAERTIPLLGIWIAAVVGILLFFRRAQARA